MRTAFAQTAQQASDAGAGWEPFALQMLGLFFIVLVFYVLFIRPQRKKDEERKQLINRLARNDQVITIGGLKGKVVGLGEHEITLEVDAKNNTRIRVLRTAVSSVESAKNKESQ